MNVRLAPPASIVVAFVLAGCGAPPPAASPSISRPADSSAGSPGGGGPGAIEPKGADPLAGLTGNGGGGTESKGRLPPEQIQRTIKQHMGAFKQCYDAGLKKNPAMKGRLTMKFTIDPEGRAKHAVAAESSLGDDDVVACILGELRKLTFPKPEGGIVSVAYPLELSP